MRNGTASLWIFGLLMFPDTARSDAAAGHTVDTNTQLLTNIQLLTNLQVAAAATVQDVVAGAHT